LSIAPAIENPGGPCMKHTLRLYVNRMFRLCCVVVAMWSLSACAAGSVARDPQIQISGMVMENQTEMYLSAVSLLVPATGGFVSCGTITPGSRCSTTFPEVNYSGNPVEITWSLAGQIHTTGPFHLQIPTDLDQRKAAEVRVVISGPETAGAIIVQHPD
jgi:hypothetical protein